MRIGIEMRWVTLGHAGGVAILLRGVLRRLVALHPEHEYFIFCTIFNRSLLAPLPGSAEFITVSTHNYWTALNRLAAEKNLGVFFRGYPVEDELHFPLARQIFQIPDIQHEHYPEFFDDVTLRSRRLAFARALGGAGAIGTISEFARGTLLAQRVTRCQDVFLMGPALRADHGQAPEQPLTEAELALAPGGDFFLFPANLWRHKNHRRVLQAFARFIAESGRPMELILTGHPSGWNELRAEFPGLPVRHLGFVRAALLRLLYERARALVYFSLYEGFGMPLLEAFDAGTPVICSNTTSLPEIGGDAVLSCDPIDVERMSQLMARIVEESDLRAELAARGKERLGAYSWDQSAENLHAACQRVAGAARPSETVVATLEEVPKPLVSIVTPSYNQGRFLRRTIESILKQTYPRIEYRVVDGGSTDSSLEILKSYGDRFAWSSERDRGQTDAINKGFAHARGEIRAYLNSDDLLLPRAVETIVSHFVRNPECDLVYGRAYYTDEEDRSIGDYATADYSFERLMRDCCICQPAAFWRSRIAQKIGPFNDRLHYAMDYDYWIRIARAGGRIEHIPDVLACSRLHSQTKTLSARFDIYREILDVTRREGGYTSRNYFQGLWHHICHERRGLGRWLGRVPYFERMIGRLHHAWWNRNHFRARRLLANAGRALQRRLVRHPFLAVRLVPWLRRQAKAEPRNIVFGYWTDEMLEPTFTVLRCDRTPGGMLHLVGTAPVEMFLHVCLDGESIGKYHLRSGVYETVDIGPFARPGLRLTLRFSKHVTDPAGRRLSFRVHDTNLFSEHDLIYVAA